ncbi:MAG: efflux RND transporter periplasmic adaptor subunit [Shimia sp.]
MSKIGTITKRIAMGTGRLGLTAAFFGVAGIAVVAGSEMLTLRAEAAAPSPETPPTPVATRVLNREAGFATTRAFVGQIEAAETAQVSFELGGRLAEILVDEGDPVAAGQVLARQDTALLEAERAQLEASSAALGAQRGFALDTLDRARELNDRGFASQERLDQARAQLDELDARLREVEAGLRTVAIRLDKTELRAPFAGTVTVRAVDGGETLGTGQPVATLVGAGPGVLRVGLPVALDPAAIAAPRAEIDGRVVALSLRSVRPDVDPVTRTRTVLFDVAPGTEVAFGQTARLLLDRFDATPGVWVPTRALEEGAAGVWTLLVVDGEDRVARASVEVLHAAEGRVFVRGSFPDGTRMIEAGPQRVTVGQAVAVLGDATATDAAATRDRASGA